MGWCSGTSIFDRVAKDVLSLKIPDLQKKKILENLLEEMRGHDWDCEGDSEYWDDKFVGPILGNREG